MKSPRSVWVENILQDFPVLTGLCRQTPLPPPPHPMLYSPVKMCPLPPPPKKKREKKRGKCSLLSVTGAILANQNVTIKPPREKPEECPPCFHDKLRHSNTANCYSELKLRHSPVTSDVRCSQTKPDTHTVFGVGADQADRSFRQTTLAARQHWPPDNTGRQTTLAARQQTTLAARQHWPPDNTGRQTTLAGRQHWPPDNTGRQTTLAGRQHWPPDNRQHLAARQHWPPDNRQHWPPDNTGRQTTLAGRQHWPADRKRVRREAGPGRRAEGTILNALYP